MIAPRPSVLLVDDDPGALETLGAVLEHQGFDISLAISPDAARARLREQRFDAVVTDVVFDGFAEGEHVLRDARHAQPETVVVLLTGYPALSGAVSAIKNGAYDYVEKPVDPSRLADKLRRGLRERAIHEDTLDFSELVKIVSEMVATSIERVDPYTAGHGQRTREYCGLLARALTLSPLVCDRLELAAIAHDYGKIFLDDTTFLTKAGPLSPTEFREVQRHPSLGATKLGQHGRLREVCRYVAEHHEKWDGSGYPRRLRQEEISLPGRILGVVEVFDGLATRRSYKEPWDLARIQEFFRAQRGRAFDPLVLDAFDGLLEAHGERWIRRGQPG